MKMEAKLFITVIAVSVLTAFTNGNLDTEYLVGTGIGDVTGPAADVNLMGYANPAQVTGGIHLRIYSRAFIIAHKSNPKQRAVFVSVDCGMQGQGVTLEVLKNLKKKFGKLYTEQNVAISGTHTHSTPAGFLQYVLYDVTSLGFVKETFDALVDGITMSIIKADKNIQPANIYINEGHLYNASINRSPSAYEANPLEERSLYDTNIDTLMTVLKFTDASGNPFAMLNWFAVHGTSMNNTNRLISGDNKGYASYLVEHQFNQGQRPGKGSFVAAFAQSHLGDVSPNTMGAKCIDSGKPCERNSSTCDGKNEKCIAFGPGKNMFESTRIIGERQYEKAMELFNTSEILLSGPVSFLHQYVDMTNVTVRYNDSFSGKTCKPAMGYSFAAGTTDGPGAFDFTQGTTSSNPFWRAVTSLIKKPSKELIACQAPKPILLATGETHFPYDWSPGIVDTMILKVGQLVIAPIPGEFTTMSGRRLRNVINKTMTTKDSETPYVVIAGLSNTYSDYIATYEEYQVQRYEAASTIYGPHTLQAYLNQYEKLALHLKKGSTLPKGPTPVDLITKQLSFLPPVIFDAVPPFQQFGSVVKDVQSSYRSGDPEPVTATFRSGNPRNNLRTDRTFLSVEKKDEYFGNFTEVYNDADWCTRFIWERTDTVLGFSEATVWWDIPEGTNPGTYRLHHYGDHKSLIGGVKSYEGVSSEFTVK